MTHFHQYDAIAIGSGIGGLTAAALLSKFNRKNTSIAISKILASKPS